MLHLRNSPPKTLRAFFEMIFLVRGLCASLVTSPGVFSGDQYEVKLSFLRLQDYCRGLRKVIAIARFLLSMMAKKEIVDPVSGCSCAHRDSVM